MAGRNCSDRVFVSYMQSESFYNIKLIQDFAFNNFFSTASTFFSRLKNKNYIFINFIFNNVI